MKITYLGVVLLFVGLFSGVALAQPSVAPLRLTSKRVCDRNFGSTPVRLEMDAARNKFVACVEYYNGQGGVEIAIKVAKLDPSATQVLYSHVFPFSGFTNGTDIAVASDGTAYVLFGNGIMRISADGSTVDMAWSSVSLSEVRSMIFDAAGNLYIAGRLNNDASVVKVLADGSIGFSTPFVSSGDDIANALALAPSGEIVVAGTVGAGDLPIINAFQPTFGGGPSDAFVARLDPNSGATNSLSYHGGNQRDEGYAAAVASSGNIIVGGDTESSNFPILNALQSTYGGLRDGFVTKLNSAASSAMFSGFLGGNNEDGVRAISVDNLENVMATGVTRSPNFPQFRSPTPSLQGNWQSFLTRMSSSGSAYVFSGYNGAGANNFLIGFDFMEDGFNGLFLAVSTHSFQGGGDAGELQRFSPYQAIPLFDDTKPFKPNPTIRVQVQDLRAVNHSSGSLTVTSIRVSPRGNPTIVSKSLGANLAYDANLKYGGSAKGGYELTFDRTGLAAGDYDLVFTVAGESVERFVPFSLK